MRARLLLLASILAAATAGAALADPLAIQRPETQAAAALQVHVSGVTASGALEPQYSGYGKNVSPPIQWSGAPAGTKAYALFVEDADGQDPDPTIHWIAWNIPAADAGLSRGIKNMEEPKRPLGMRQGPNSHGGVGWTGPHPPIGDAPHHFHVQVFALDRTLGVGGGGSRETVIRAMKGHVLARGEAVVTYQQLPERDRSAGGRRQPAPEAPAQPQP